jgi:putative FmdB family regulatory protein
MPIYEYRCDNGHQFEVIQRMSDDPVETCEECGAPVERVFHPVAVHFKGSGFYTTDYAKKSKAGAGAGKDGDSGTSEGSDSKADSSSKSDSGSSGESKSGDSASKSSAGGDKAKSGSKSD